MKLFKCNNCGHVLFFENTVCLKCNSLVGFIAEEIELQQLIPHGKDTYKVNDSQYDIIYQYCANHQFGVCNWMVPAFSGTVYCKACELNQTIPDLSKPEYLLRWRDIESSKHRLVYSLLRMQLPLVSKKQDKARGLRFDFIAEEHHKVFTGHSNGLITINIAEADDIERELNKRAMHETYRTLLGHFRHEIAHYYWDRLIANTSYLDGFRKLFGDETMNYEQAKRKHYSQHAPGNWSDNFISAYASMHPWEDWAETWAHYMHIIDTLETAYAYNITLHPLIETVKNGLSADIKNDPYEMSNFRGIMNMWLPLTFAMNSLNRSMGLKDAYPFVINNVITEKLQFIHQVCIHAANK